MVQDYFLKETVLGICIVIMEKNVFLLTYSLNNC